MFCQDTDLIDYLHEAVAGREYRMTGSIFGTDLIVILASTFAAEGEG
jgi:hypothetical protein